MVIMDPSPTNVDVPLLPCVTTLGDDDDIDVADVSSTGNNVDREPMDDGNDRPFLSAPLTRR